MIYTITLNPAVDYIVKVADLKPGHVNRMEFEEKFPGGKGINVSRILVRLGIKTKALGFLGGFTGYFIETFLKDEGVLTEFIKVEGDSRINIVLKASIETEIYGQGPTITQSNLDELLNRKLEIIKSGDTLVLAGRIPSTVPDNLYEVIAKWGLENGVNIVVDTSGKALLNIVKYKPFFIKPNHHELGYLFDTEIKTREEAIYYGKKLVQMGAQNVIVSMAGEGAILINENEVYVANVPKGVVVNSVGAGDSMVAGFVGTITTTNDYIKAFQTAVASGSATAFSLDLGTKEKIEDLIPKVIVEKL